MKRLSEQSLYEILEVPTTAAPPEIESAYVRAKDLYAPGSLATYSLMAPEEAALLAERIEEAKRVLLDPDARAQYDARLAASSTAAEAAQRIASTGSGAVAAGPQRPYLVPTPAPRAATPVPRSVAVAREEPPRPAEAEAAVKPEVLAVAPAKGPEPIRLEKEIPAEVPARELHVPEGTVWSGDALRRVREGRGLTVRELCDRTKVSRYHLENIEAERFTLLPAPVYLRGILLTVARELRLDGQKVARAYLERMADATAKPR